MALGRAQLVWGCTLGCKQGLRLQGPPAAPFPSSSLPQSTGQILPKAEELPVTLGAAVLWGPSLWKEAPKLEAEAGRQGRSCLRPWVLRRRAWEG